MNLSLRPSLRPLAILVCCIPSLCFGQTFFVAPNGTDSNPGTETLPFREIRKAVAKAKAGTQIHVADGSYKGFDIREKNGTDTNPIIIRALGKKAMVLPTTDRPDNRDTIYVGFSSHIVLDGLRSSNANRAAVRIDTCRFVTVRNGVFGNNQTWGIFTNHSDDLVLERNNCFGSREEHGIYFSNSGDRPVIRFNKLHHNFANGLHMNGDLSAGGDGVITGALVEANVIYENGTGGGSGINCDGVQDSIIRTNLVYNNHASGISLYRIDGGQPSRRNLVINNTVVQADDARWCLNVRDNSTGNKAFNNIFLSRHPFRGSISCDANSLSGFRSNRNIVMNRFTTTDGDSVLTLTAWRNLTGQDVASKLATEAEVFVDPSQNRYTLRQTGPAVDAGSAVAGTSTRDLLKNPRPSGKNYDIGAYEFQFVAE